MLTREQKEQLVEQLKNKLKEKKIVVFTDFRGLGVDDMNELRSKIKEEGGEYKVVKHSLLKLAVKGAGLDKASLSNIENHPLGIVFGEDEVALPKAIYNFSKDHETLKMIGGILDKNPLSLDQLNTLALIPDREELYGKIVGSLSAPLYGMVNVLQGNLRNLVYILNAYKESRG